METETANTLKEKWQALKKEQPGIRIRNAAEMLSVSEVELLATQCGENVTRLNPEFTAILGEISGLGKVMALTRNDDVVHERKGTYLNPSLDNPHVGLFVGEDIDLRIFFKPWASAFSVTEMAGDQPRYSLQFFASDGEAVHKIYLVTESNFDNFQALVKKYKSENQEQHQETQPWINDEKELPDSEIDVENFRREWIALKDTHDFFGLVKKYKLTRTQALRLAPEGNYAVPTGNTTVRKVLNLAAERQIPIMVFVGNKGMIQIHTGPVKKLADYGEWFNVLDPDFNLHFREQAAVQNWIVRKPTTDGMVTAIECYDEKGTQIVQLFGKRKPGIPELEEWRALVAEVESGN